MLGIHVNEGINKNRSLGLIPESSMGYRGSETARSTPPTTSDYKRASGRKQRNPDTANRPRRFLIESSDQYLNRLVCGV